MWWFNSFIRCAEKNKIYKCCQLQKKSFVHLRVITHFFYCSLMNFYTTPLIDKEENENK